VWRSADGVFKIVTTFVFVIALFTVALVITYVGVIVTGQL